jgi:flagellar biosynthesis protein FliR
VLFLADVALGLLSRIAPQLNAFSLSFPLKTGLTLALIGSGLLLMPRTVVNLGTHATDLLGQVV